MSVLSEWDVINELGRGIAFYPFKTIEKSLRGGCLCLTASIHAYMFCYENNKPSQVEHLLKIKKDESFIKVTKSEIQSLLKDKSSELFIEIPRGKIATIWTQESVFLGEYFCD